MNNSSKIKWITRTAVFTALLIIIQAATAALGNTLVTGSMVNLILIVSVMTCGLASGTTVALISPVFAKLAGIGPLWSIIPFIMLGNLSLVIVWHFVGNRKITTNAMTSYLAALTAGAIVKFLVLYICIVLVAVPMFLNLPEPQARVISQMFSVPQLITAAIGGGLACAVLPLVKNALFSEKAAA